MGVSQDTFNQYQVNAYPGQIANIQEAKVKSMKVEGAAVAFGAPVVNGTGARSCVNVSGSTTAALVKGFAVRTMAVENNSSGNAEYAVGDVASIIDSGSIFVTCKNGATKGASVFVVINAAGGDVVGELRGTADGANTIELNQVQWVDDVAATGVGEIRLNGILNA